MKVLFLTTHREAPSAKWRVLQFIPYFKKSGIQCFVQEWPSGTFGRLSLVGSGCGGVVSSVSSSRQRASFVVTLRLAMSP